MEDMSPMEIVDEDEDEDDMPPIEIEDEDEDETVSPREVKTIQSRGIMSSFYEEIRGGLLTAKVDNWLKRLATFLDFDANIAECQEALKAILGTRQDNITPQKLRPFIHVTRFSHSETLQFFQGLFSGIDPLYQDHIYEKFKKIIDQAFEQIRLEKLLAHLLFSIVVVVFLFEYLIGYVQRGGWETYSDTSWEFRATYVSIELRLAAYFWLKFRALAQQLRSAGRGRKRLRAEKGEPSISFHDGKFEPKVKALWGAQGMIDIWLGSFDTREEAENVFWIGEYYGGRRERFDHESNRLLLSWCEANLPPIPPNLSDKERVSWIKEQAHNFQFEVRDFLSLGALEQQGGPVLEQQGGPVLKQQGGSILELQGGPILEQQGGLALEQPGGHHVPATFWTGEGIEFLMNTTTPAPCAGATLSNSSPHTPMAEGYSILPGRNDTDSWQSISGGDPHLADHAPTVFTNQMQDVDLPEVAGHAQEHVFADPNQFTFQDLLEPQDHQEQNSYWAALIDSLSAETNSAQGDVTGQEVAMNSIGVYQNQDARHSGHHQQDVEHLHQGHENAVVPGDGDGGGVPEVRTNQLDQTEDHHALAAPANQMQDVNLSDPAGHAPELSPAIRSALPDPREPCVSTTSPVEFEGQPRLECTPTICSAFQELRSQGWKITLEPISRGPPQNGNARPQSKSVLLNLCSSCMKLTDLQNSFDHH